MHNNLSLALFKNFTIQFSKNAQLTNNFAKENEVKLWGLKLDGRLIATKQADSKPNPWEFPIPSWDSRDNYEVVELMIANK